MEISCKSDDNFASSWRNEYDALIACGRLRGM